MSELTQWFFAFKHILSLLIFILRSMRSFRPRFLSPVPYYQNFYAIFQVPIHEYLKYKRPPTRAPCARRRNRVRSTVKATQFKSVHYACQRTALNNNGHLRPLLFACRLATESLMMGAPNRRPNDINILFFE